jgi:peptidoglycan/LPS O-acetylase OafA/YrhL
MNTRPRFETLDALRGVAALSVVFWHWQWLYYPPGSTAQIENREIQPFFWLFAPLYRHGAWGVDMFFSISGFVFFYLYADAIAERSTDFLTFANYRIARLYPLHLATLLLVTVLQSAYYLHFGAFFVYQLNDVKHFVMQLLFASNWSWNSPFTFNGPVWSLSIEVLLYGIFFVVAFARMTSSIVLALLAVAGALIVRVHPLLGHGLLSFFTGGLCLYIVREWRANHRLDVGALVAFIAVVTLSTVIQRIRHDLSLMERLVEVVAFPAIIVALALNEERLLPITSRLKWLGDISYSSYLLHFPLALALVTLAAYANFAVNPSSGALLLAYFVVLIAVSTASYRYFESPLRRLLRLRR